MRLVLDTNVIVQMLPSRSPYNPILKAFQQGKFVWIVTYDVYLEYLEILQQRGAVNADFFIQKLLFESGQVADTKLYFFFHAIDADPDDNKFVDAYLTGQADYLVTWDNHFNVLKRTDFPKVNVITPDQLLDILSKPLVD